MAACVGCFQTLGGSLLYAACGARFRARSRGEAKSPDVEAIGGRWSSTVRYTRKSSSVLALSVWLSSSFALHTSL